MVEPTDIDDYLPVFEQLALRDDVNVVVELGVRDGNSTRAWLRGLAGHGHLWSVDIVPPPADVVPPEHDDDWTMILGDDVSADVLAQIPERIDVLFIDTDHSFEHTLDELYLYGRRVRSGGAILLHDTENEHPEDHGEMIGVQEPFPVKRAMQKYAQERRAVAHLDDRGWGLGQITIP